MHEKSIVTTNEIITFEEARNVVRSMTLINNFLFNYVMEDEDRAKEVASIIISAAVGYDVIVDSVKPQKVLTGNDKGDHGIRLDAFIDNTKTQLNSVSSVYDIEMEDREADRKDLPKRHRYYSSMVESKLLKSGKFYNTLPDYISITILSYDPFLAGDMYYEAKTTLVTHKDIEYDDGRRYIFLYSGGNYNIPESNTHGKKLSEMIKYIVTGKLEDNAGEDTQRLRDIVDTVKDRSEVTKNYMKEWMRQQIHDHELTEQVTQEVTERVTEQVTQQVTQKVTNSINSLNTILISLGRIDDLEKATKDPEYQQKLMKELLPGSK
ncbi:hypothetical protein [Butyrivibrio sp. MB2005]|uniref:hypothetical protein n=1 Tax=Butyrivibrio sp. MB2005 TaxID=1280678 RepID=UPI0004178BA0|nr:hypothetical protein [Butyrivibrio sp. MB2005]